MRAYCVQPFEIFTLLRGIEPVCVEPPDCKVYQLDRFVEVKSLPIVIEGRDDMDMGSPLNI